MELKLFILAALACNLAVPIDAASEVTSFVEVLNQDTFDEATKEVPSQYNKPSNHISLNII